MSDENQALTTCDIARLLNRTPDTIRWMERRGLIQATRTAGGQRIFTRSEAERILRERADQESS